MIGLIMGGSVKFCRNPRRVADTVNAETDNESLDHASGILLDTLAGQQRPDPPDHGKDHEGQ